PRPPVCGPPSSRLLPCKAPAPSPPPPVAPPRRAVSGGLPMAAARVLAVEPYQSGECCETAVLRQLLGQLALGIIVVAVRFSCSYFMVPLLHACGVVVVLRLHRRRHTDFRRGRLERADDHVERWPAGADRAVNPPAAPPVHIAVV